MHPKSKKRFTLKIVLSYAVLGVLAILAAFLIYNEFKSYASTKNQGESNKKLLKVNMLLTQLYDAENLSKLVLQTKKPEDLQSYAQKVDSITQFIESLKPLAKTNYGDQSSKLDSVQLLLKQKVFNNAELRNLKVKNENSTSLDSVLKAFHEMEVDMGRITPSTFAPNFDELPPKTQEYIKDYVAILNRNIPNSGGNTDANNIDSILEVSKSILNQAKTVTASVERSVLQKELEIYRTDLELSQKLRSILTGFEREMTRNSYLDNLKQEQTLKKSFRLAAGAVLLGLLTVILFTLMISKDYWKVQQYRLQLEKAKKYSESLLRSREQLISTVSHDLRTPLNTISGYSDLIEQSGLNTKQQNHLNKIKSSSEYVQKLVNDLLDYSKLEAGKIKLDKVPFELTQLLEEITVDFEEIRSKKGVSLQLEIDEDLKTPINTDPFRIRQILTNLIGNAFKFTQSGHVKICAKVEVKNKVKWLRVDVEDTGIGISRKNQESIFQEFTQVKELSQKVHVGYGLGLTISKKLTELLGGKLSLKSKMNQGSTFTVQIPVTFSKKELIKNNFNKHISQPEALSILVIDDDENMLGLISELCKVNDIQTTTFTDFNKFELSKINQFDAVLTDIQMPTINGFSVLKAIKKLESNISVIAMTGQQIDKKKDYLNAGFTDVIQKPFSAKTLLQVLNFIKKPNIKSDVPDTGSSMFTVDNISAFLEDKISVKEVLQVFLKSSSQNIDFLFFAAEEQDYPRIRAISHKILPMFRQLEAQNAIDLLEVLQDIPDDTQEDKVLKILSELKIALSKLETQIQGYLAKLSVGID
ncbi:ATP-binding protein [Allomuricauda sp. F6463D]|uniref:hybrid sensor histidine kinase/response regulator n=1 Tax=Allomuricauda sp. F6463D TaxID=2926409 RepID=UPI001FF4BD83|nr:ATP-binding protein [Muricauda sp. F6463D]MCK0161465.1 ATP-binding protein [Muricauda sp. F6463D]